MTSERDTLESGGSSIRCTRIDVTITDKAFLDFLNDCYDILEDDETIANYIKILDNDLTRYAYDDLYDMYNQMLREMRNIIRELERSYSGDIVVSLYVGSRNRLLRVEISADLSMNRDRVRIRGSLDFGESAQDRWALQMTITEGSYRDSMRVIWDYRERSNGIENTITFTPDNGRPSSIRSTYSPDRGGFTLSIDDGWSDTSMSGVFTKTDDGGFRLSLNDIINNSYSDESLSLDIRVEPGAGIRRVDFVNIDRWDAEVLESFVAYLEPLFGGDHGDTTAPAPSIWLSGNGGDVYIPHYSEITFIPDTTGVWEIFTWDNASSDPYLELLDSSRSMIAWDDDSGGDYNAYMAVHLEAGTRYTIVARFWGGGSGSYMLTVLPPTDDGGDGGGGSPERRPVIGLATNSMAGNFSSHISQGMMYYAHDNDYAEIILLDADFNMYLQVEQIETFVAMGVDGIVIMPINLDVLMLAGISGVSHHLPVVIVTDIELPEDILRLWDNAIVVGTDPVEFGEVQAQLAIDAWWSGEIRDRNGDGVMQHLIMQGNLNSHFAVGRTEGNQRELDSGSNKVPSQELDIQSADWNPDIASDITQSWLRQYGDSVDVILCNNDSMAFGASDVVMASGLDIPVIGIDAIPYAVDRIADGVMFGSVLRCPWDHARIAVDLIVNQAHGRDWFHGNEWGNRYSATENKVMVMPVPITIENILLARISYFNCGA